MELIIPKAEIWEQGDGLDNMWKHIARCTRVCYQSTPKNNGESDEEFVKRVILRDSSTGEQDFNKVHGAMLEHGTVHLMATTWDHNPLRHYWTNEYSRVKQIHLETEHCQSDTSYKYAYYVTTNLRVICENNWFEDLKYVCKPTEHHAKRVTVSFTTNIGVTREFNRHRVNSIAEESTRYCNYNKRNDGQLKIGLPAWLLGENNSYVSRHKDDGLLAYCYDIVNGAYKCWNDVDNYIFALLAAEYAYKGLICHGWKPQQAREVLPLATKSQLIHTAFIDDWEHFFALRANGVSGPPHPNAKLLAEPLKEEFIKRGYI